MAKISAIYSKYYFMLQYAHLWIYRTIKTKLNYIFSYSRHLIYDSTFTLFVLI